MELEYDHSIDEMGTFDGDSECSHLALKPLELYGLMCWYIRYWPRMNLLASRRGGSKVLTFKARLLAKMFLVDKSY